jgi:glycosyltransferase involved in cell wall biosynthesis
MFRRLVASEHFLRLVAISGELGDHYAEQFDIPDIVVAHDCADDPPDAYERLGDGETMQIGYIGQLHEGKGMAVIAELVRRCEWAEFHIVGGMEEDIERWRTALEDASNITFHGYVPYAETHRYRQSVDVALAPYQREVYGHGGGNINLGRWMSPLKLFEYMAAGTPIVASDLPVLREVLVDEETALLCEPAALNEWERALERLRDDPEERKRLSENAREAYEANYTWKMRCEMVLDGVRLQTE